MRWIRLRLLLLVKLAQSQGIKVIAYDRPIPDAKSDFYVSFDNEAIGKSIAESLVKHLKDKGVPTDKGGVLPVSMVRRLMRRRPH